MPKQNGKYPDELRDRAVRMVLEHGHEYGSQWEAICSVADKRLFGFQRGVIVSRRGQLGLPA